MLIPRIPVVRVLGLLLVLAVAAVGCGSDDEGGGPASTPTPSASAGLTGPLVFSVGGGIAGRANRMTLQPDGAAVIEDARGGSRKSVQVAAKAMGEIETAIADADLPSQPKAFKPDTPVADGLGYRLEYDGRTLTVEDGANTPAPVKALMARLNAVVTSYR